VLLESIMERSSLNERESGVDVDAVHQISNLLETGLSKRVLTVLLMLLEQGYSAESLVRILTCIFHYLAFCHPTTNILLLFS